MLKVYLCDDNAQFLDAFILKLKRLSREVKVTLEVMFSATNPVDFFYYLESHQVERGIFFLDIDLKHQITGLDLAAKIKELVSENELIFLTAHTELAIATLQRRLAPLDFLVKNDERINEKIKELLLLLDQKEAENSKNKEPKFTFSIASQQIRLEFNKIDFLESSSIPHKVNLYANGELYQFYGKLQEFEDKYQQLVRVHKAYLINPQNVKKIDYQQRLIIFESGKYCTFPVSKRYIIKSLFDK